MRIGSKIALTADLIRARLAFRRRGHDARRVLAIRLDGFGDFSLYLPYALALRELYPRGEYHLALCANAAWSEVAERLLPFDEFIALEVRRYMTDMEYRRRMDRRVAAGRYGTLLQPRFFREPLLEDRLALAAGAEAGYAFQVGDAHLQAALGRSLEKRLYGRRVACPTEWHESRKDHAFADALGAVRGVPRPELPPPLPEWAPGCYLVVLPGSGKGRRAAWFPERWGEALAGCDLPCAVAGTAAEAPLVDSAARSLGDRAMPLAGKLTAWEFARLLAHARMVVGNDTGGIHFAAWCGVPALAVTGGGHPGWYYPYPEEFTASYVCVPHPVGVDLPCAGCAWRCTRRFDTVCPCVAEVPAKRVAAELARMLAVQPRNPNTCSAR